MGELPQEKVDAFLEELTQLSKKHGIYIGYGLPYCCYKPGLTDADLNYFWDAKQALDWDFEQQKYIVRD